MARFIKTISADGTSSGGSGAGVSLAEVCTAVCKVVCNNATRSTSGITESITAPQQVPGFSEWEIICNCPCWTDCYGCQVVWCFPATKPYSAYRIYYKGMGFCACCYMNFMMGLGTDSCFCCCNYSYCGGCVCTWPGGACCTWSKFQRCEMLQDACYYCCNSPNWAIVDMDICVFSIGWIGNYGCSKGFNIGYDVRWQKFPGTGWDSFEYNGVNRARTTGSTNFCQCMVWGTEQNSQANRQFTRLCMCTSSTPFLSALSGGNYLDSGGGGALQVGIPCWTIYGKPCHRPQFGTVSGSMA